MIVFVTDTAVYFNNKRLGRDGTLSPSPCFGTEYNVDKNSFRMFIADVIVKDRDPVLTFRRRYDSVR